MSRSLVGRNRELTLLRVMLAAALDGGGSLVLLGGDAGIGKTRLAEELARVAEARRAMVVWGSRVEDAAPPYWHWVQVLHACARPSELESASAPLPGEADLDDLLPGALPTGEAAPRPVSPGESRQLRFRLFDRFFTRLQEAAGSRPLVVVLDDLQWADSSSLLLLEFVASHLHSHRLLVLGLYRDSKLVSGSPLSHSLSRLSRLGTVIRLGGLTADESIRLANDIADSPVSERVALLVHQRSEGNPFFIHEVVRLLESQGRLKSLTHRGASSLAMLPQTVADVIHERSAPLSDVSSRVLAEASVIGDEFGADILTEVTGVPDAELVGLLREAVRADLIQPPDEAATRYRFAHALVRETFSADLPSSRRAALHRRVGEAIEVRSDKPESQSSALAHHFDLASTADTREKALHYARSAGRRALHLLAYEEAAEHFALALDLLDQLGDEESQQMELLLALGDARMSAGERRGAVDAYGRASESARRLGQAEELARAALGFADDGSGFEARPVDQHKIDLLEEALAALGQEESALRAWVLARLSVATIGRHSPEQRADLSRRAAEIARQVGDERALADSLSSYCHAISGPAHTEERLECALEIVRVGEETRVAEIELFGRRFRVPALLEMGDRRAADEEVEPFARIAEGLEPPLLLWYVPLWRGMQALMEGRLADSERLTAEVRTLGRQAGSPDADLLADAQHLVWLIESGQDKQARDLLARWANGSEDAPNAEPFMVPLLARSGRPTEAQSILSRLSAEHFSRLEVQDTWLLAMCMLAWGCVEIGDGEAGAKIYDLLLPYEQRFAVNGAGAVSVGSVSRYLGLLAHSLGRLGEADGHFGRALEAHRRVGASLLLAHSLRQHAAMLLERGGRGDRNRSEGMLREAISIYGQLGLVHWAKAARELPGVEPEPAAEANGANVFRREGDVWLLRFDGDEARVKDTRGLRAIARLLASPGRDFHVLDLVADVAPSAGGDAGVDDTSEQGDAGAVSDERARAEYRQRLAVLDKEINEAVMGDDPERANRARVERRAILAQLTASYGYAGRPGRGGDPTERAQSTMAWRIGAALARIERAHRALASHLRHSIRIGMFCSYSPDWATSWTVE